MEYTTKLLTFGEGNAKLGKHIHTFSLPAGHTCPAATECRSHADRQTGHITDGPDCRFRCFAASAEAVFPNVRDARWANYECLLSCRNCIAERDAMAELIHCSLAELTPAPKWVRVHVSGDFFSEPYYRAWMDVASYWEDTTFYAYTKMIPFWIKHGRAKNFFLTASLGGKYDHLLRDHPELRTARVVFSEAEASELGLELDHDDSHAIGNGGNFALLLHGTQPAGSPAAAAKRALKGKGAYGKGTK